jgi:hypothetical protein
MARALGRATAGPTPAGREIARPSAAWRTLSPSVGSAACGIPALGPPRPEGSPGRSRANATMKTTTAVEGRTLNIDVLAVGGLLLCNVPTGESSVRLRPASETSGSSRAARMLARGGLGVHALHIWGYICGVAELKRSVLLPQRGTGRTISTGGLGREVLEGRILGRRLPRTADGRPPHTLEGGRPMDEVVDATHTSRGAHLSVGDEEFGVATEIGPENGRSALRRPSGRSLGRGSLQRSGDIPTGGSGPRVDFRGPACLQTRPSALGGGKSTVLRR